MAGPITGFVRLIDKAVELLFNGLDSARVFDPISLASYNAVKRTFAAQLKLTNDFEILGAKNLPQQGGIIFASNHQSWLDAFTLMAASPRRLHFIAKSELGDFPLVRQGIRFSKSLYVQRGGDDEALQLIVQNLQGGKSICIFPEGTIPGEEDIPRRKRDPDTGLLEGRTGAVRLAIRSKTPIIPVGISGTERVLPPEVYPRLELFRMPRGLPVTVRFGKPIYLDNYHYEDIDRATLRHLTEEMMLRISGLVDHSSKYIPVRVPAPQTTLYEKVGVLLLHGFTSHLESVAGLIPHLEKANIPYAAPILRGHGTRYKDLVGVTAKDWYVDAEHALINLWNRVDKVVVVGFSMGGLVALELAMRHPGKIAGMVSAAASLKFTDPLARFSRRLARAMKYADSPNPFSDPTMVENSKNYKKFPVETFASLYEYSMEIKQRLREVHVPIRILHSKNDSIIMPVSANVIYEHVSSPRREILWYNESGHELFNDIEAEQVMKDVMEFVESFIKRTHA